MCTSQSLLEVMSLDLHQNIVNHGSSMLEQEHGFPMIFPCVSLKKTELPRFYQGKALAFRTQCRPIALERAIKHRFRTRKMILRHLHNIFYIFYITQIIYINFIYVTYITASPTSLLYPLHHLHLHHVHPLQHLYQLHLHHIHHQHHFHQLHQHQFTSTSSIPHAYRTYINLRKFWSCYT